MKNTLSDLNDHLFAQVERLTDENLTTEKVEAEVRRTEALVQIADSIVDNARLQLEACKLVAEHGDRFAMPLRVALPSPQKAAS